jgi:2',3'-cyclic-nucleotide 2'-phosphodiesterase (5'-nucleotidase family)
MAIQEVKKTGMDVLILDAGDLLFYKNVKPSLPSAQQERVLLSAQLVAEAFNLMGCDAVGIGEDDLRLGAKAFTKVKKKATFPFVSANVARTYGRKISVPYLIKDAGGLRWGIFSLMSANPSLKAQDRDWKVLDPVSKGRQVVKELLGKADIIVLLAAMPLKELKPILSQVPGITVAVAGHNPSGLRKTLQVGQTIVVGNYAYGRYLGMLTLSLKNPEAPFVDEARIMQLERELAVVEGKIKEKASGSFIELKQKMEAELEELKQGNSYRNEFIMLSSRFHEDPQVQKLIADFSAKQKQLRQGCQ